MTDSSAAGEIEGLELLEQSLGKLSLDTSGSQVNCLVVELEKLMVDSTVAPNPNEPPGQEKVEVPSQQMQKKGLQQLLEVLKSPDTPESRQQIQHHLKNFPALLAAFIKQRHVLLQTQTCQKALTGQVALRQSASNANQAKVICHQSQKIELQQLLKVLKSPDTPERRQQIQHLLKNFPSLMAAVIKHRQMFLQIQKGLQASRQNASNASRQNASNASRQNASNAIQANIRAQQKLALMRQHLRAMLYRQSTERRQPGSHQVKTNPQLLAGILKLHQKIRQVQNPQHSIGTMSQMPPQRQVVAQYLRRVRSPKPGAPLRPVLLKKILRHNIIARNGPDMLVLYSPASVNGNQSPPQRLQMAKALYLSKLRHQSLSKSNSQQPGPAAQRSKSYYCLSGASEMPKHDLLDPEEPVIAVQKLS